MTGLANGMALEITDFCIEALKAVAGSVCLASVAALPGPVRVDLAVWFPEKDVRPNHKEHVTGMRNKPLFL